MKIPSSLRQLAIEIEAVSGDKCAWILFDPASPIRQKLLRLASEELVRPSNPERVSASACDIPTRGQGATSRAGWVRKLVAALAVVGRKQNEIFVLPLVENNEVKACFGWFYPGQAGGSARLLPHLPAIRTLAQRALALEKARTEAGALRWLLTRSDRPCVAARPSGELLGTSLPAREFLKELRFGKRHFFRTDDPELPPALARSIAQLDAGQVVISPTCTARFGQLPRAGEAWLPVVGIEFFSEDGPQVCLPLSRLTPVERDILDQIAAGATNREIARERGTAHATVKNQVAELLRKTGFSRRINLIAPRLASQFSHMTSAVGVGDSITVDR